MSESLSSKQVKAYLEYWGSWVLIDAVAQLDKLIEQSKRRLREELREAPLRHIQTCQQYGVDPARVPLCDAAFREWRAHIEDLRAERDRISGFLETMEKAISRLNANQQAYLRGKYVYMKPLTSISAELGLSEDHVRRLSVSSVNKLRKLLSVPSADVRSPRL